MTAKVLDLPSSTVATVLDRHRMEQFKFLDPKEPAVAKNVSHQASSHTSTSKNRPDFSGVDIESRTIA